MAENARSMPYDEQAEKSVLGSMLLDRAAVFVAEQMLRKEDFYLPANQEIFRSILNLSEKGENIDALLVSRDMMTRGTLEKSGGIEYIISLSNDVGLTSNIRAYCKMVEEKSTLRDLITASSQIIDESFDLGEKTSDVVAKAEKRIFDITQKTHVDGLTKLSKSLEETANIMEKMAGSKGDITGVTTGISDLNKHLSGLHRQELVLLAARPSMGKTAFGVNIAVSAAKDKKIVAIFSLEMGKIQLVQRIMATISMISLTNIINGDIDDWEAIGNTLAIMEGLPIYIDDTPSISLTELRAKCRRLKVEEGLDLVVIDYLQLMTTTKRTENRQLEISEISRGLKALAKELNCPVLALAQLSRAPELRTNKRPILSDLRESGAIEQDADVVLMLYRDDYYNEDSERPNTADVIIAKNRNGATGSIEMTYLKELTKFIAKDVGSGN